MARKYGKNETTLNNVLKLVKALLALADGEIDVPGDKLKATFYVEWVKEDELLVSGKVQPKRNNRSKPVEKGITKEDLWTLVECLGEGLELSQPKDEEKKPTEAERKANAVQDILDCLKDLEILVEELINGKPTVKTQGFWKFSLKLKHQTAERKDNLKVIEERWQIKIGSIATNTSDETFRSKDKFLNWREICSQKLAEKKFTTKVFQRYGAELQLDKNYVRLAIVERKLPKPPSKNQQEEKEEEKPIPMSEKSFFEDVLRQGKSDISQGRKIAIIGEPGSGKTTRLQKIADWILEPDQEDLGFPIWIDLADLENQNICQYLENKWLPECKGEVKRRDLEPEISRAWLLLDGVDEMSRTQRIEQLAKDLSSSWLQDVRVVVTCRVNVWEADKNAFSGFDVFRNLEFNPEQVTDYIRRWFAAIGDAATGESLEAALAQSENSRLKELIQNPLRLWMLCQIWQTGGSLPETQAGLYGQFVDWVYRWKAEEEILDQREAIDKALARLALAAMEQKDEVSRLRLPESWVLKVLGSRPIFQAVMKLGWLNRVERFPEAICVFYHATFQEYFAALAVDHWDYFLPRNHVDCPVVGKEYRIFEPQWKQVILLWIGRTNLKNNKEKEKFIHKLIYFEYGCSYYEHDFYKFRAQFLAAWLIQDLENNDWKNYFINWLIKIGVGWWNSENNEWQYSLDLLNSSIARQTLIQINTDFAREKLLEIIDRTDEDFILSRAVWCLVEMYPCSDRVINKLLSLICKSSKTATEYKVSGVHYQAIRSLSKIAFKNQKAILFLKELIDSRIDLSTKIIAIKTLAKISPDFVNEASRILLTILNDTSNDGLRCDLAIALGEISPIHQEFVVDLLAKIPIKHESITERKVEKYLASIQKKSVLTANSEFTVNQEYDIIQDLIKLVNDIVTDFNEKRRIIELLSPLLDSNKVDEETNIYKLLLDIIILSNSESLKYVIGYSLQETKKTQAQLLFIVEYLSKYLTLDSNRVHYQLLWDCAQNLPYPDFYCAWHGLTETQTSPLV